MYVFPVHDYPDVFPPFVLTVLCLLFLLKADPRNVNVISFADRDFSLWYL